MPDKLQRHAGLSLAFAVLLLTVTAIADAPQAPLKPPTGRTPAIELGPRLLDPDEQLIGQRISNQSLTAVDGSAAQLFEPGGAKATVVVVRDPGCPVSRRYGPGIARLAAHYADGFRFVFIYPSVELSAEQRVNDARTLPHMPGSLFVAGGSLALAGKLGVRGAGDVFVIDDRHRLRYRGAVDDQFGLGYTKDFPTRHYLRNAMDAVQHGRRVAVQATSAPGCLIDADPAKERLPPWMPAGQLLSLRA